jgi:hypothetical protein
MFRNLIPALADRYHVIAPDYPGFGQSGTPDCLRRRVSLPPRVHHRVDLRTGRVLGGRRSQEIAPRDTQEATVTASPLRRASRKAPEFVVSPSTHSGDAHARRMNDN